MILKLFKSPSSYKETAPLRGYRCYDGKVEFIEPVAVAQTVSLSSGIVQSPGFVSINGHVYDLSQNGVYRFYSLPSLQEQRIVCAGGADALFRMIGYLWLYGGRDNHLSLPVALASIIHRPIVSGCGNLSFLAQSIFREYGIESRVVAGMTQVPWNGQDDGHTLLEVFNGQQWILYDPSYNSLFTTNAQYVNLNQVAKSRMENIDLRRLPALPGHGEFSRKDYDYAFWMEERLMSEELLKKWYAHVLDVPMIFENDNFVFNQSALSDREDNRFKDRYSALDESKFISKFYGETNDA